MPKGGVGSESPMWGKLMATAVDWSDGVTMANLNAFCPGLGTPLAAVSATYPRRGFRIADPGHSGRQPSKRRQINCFLEVLPAQTVASDLSPRSVCETGAIRHGWSIILLYHPPGTLVFSCHHTPDSSLFSTLAGQPVNHPLFLLIRLLQCTPLSRSGRE